MSTRAMYTFTDADGSFNVYKHHDGYPAGAIEALLSALPFAWELPRFEADEFAAAFIAGSKAFRVTDLAIQVLEQLPNDDALRNIRWDDEAAKTFAVTVKPDLYIKSGMNGGGVRLMKSGAWKKVAPGDIEYRYDVRMTKTTGLVVNGYELSGGWGGAPWVETLLFSLPLLNFKGWDRLTLRAWEETLRPDETAAA